MRVLGIDPGYGRMGVAVLAKSRPAGSPDPANAGFREDGKMVILYSDCLETSARDHFADRLGQLQNNLREIIKKWQPKRIAIEKLYFTSNQKTAMQVAEVRGMIIALTQEMKIKLREYTPLQVKTGVTGYGRATKSQMAQMLPKLIKFDNKEVGKKLRDDEYDAIAIALTDIATPVIHSKN